MGTDANTDMTRAEAKLAIECVLRAENEQMERLGRPLHPFEARWLAVRVMLRLFEPQSWAEAHRRAEQVSDVIRRSRAMVE
jgi:hypothetical protein